MKQLWLLTWVFLACFLCQCDQKQAEPSASMKALLEEVNQIRSPNNKEKAKLQLEEGFRIIEHPNALDRYYYYDFYCWYNQEEKDWPLALDYADSMKAVLQGISGVEKQFAHALNTRGAVLKRMRLYSEALKEFYAADVFTVKYLDSCSSAVIFANLGAVLYEQGNYLQSLNYYKKSCQSAQTCAESERTKYFITLQSSYNSLGLCFENLNMPDSARVYYQKAIGFLEVRKQRFPEDSNFSEMAQGVVYGNLGNTEMKAGNWDRAENYFLMSIDINSKMKYDSNDAALTQIKLAKLYLLQKDYPKAQKELQSVKNFLQRRPYPEAEMRSLLLEKEFYDSRNQPDSAYRVFQTHVKIRDSLSLMNKELNRVDVKAALVSLSQKDQLRELREREERRSMYLIGSVVLLLTLLVFVYLIRRNLKESRSHVHDLNKLNAEIKEQNEQLFKAMKALEESFEENERVMRIVAHDLRNPIGSIVSLSELLNSSIDLDEKSKQYAELINSLGRDSLGFMEEVLNLKTSIEVVDRTEEDLHELMTYCISFMRFKAHDKGQQIELKGNSARVYISREKIWRVFNNLLSNAIKFSPTQTTIVIQIEQQAKQVLVSIRDQGIGIPDDLKDKVFDMLTSAKRKGTLGEQPHGLGLAISKQIIEAHGGKIWLESNEEMGTTFYMTFPIQEA